LRARVACFAKLEVVDGSTARASAAAAWRDDMLSAAEKCAESHSAISHTCLVRVDFDALESDYAERALNPDLRLQRQ
jgi:hypothetical protein